MFTLSVLSSLPACLSLKAREAELGLSCTWPSFSEGSKSSQEPSWDAAKPPALLLGRTSLMSSLRAGLCMRLCMGLCGFYVFQKGSRHNQWTYMVASENTGEAQPHLPSLTAFPCAAHTTEVSLLSGTYSGESHDLPLWAPKKIGVEEAGTTTFQQDHYMQALRRYKLPA